MQFDYPLYYKLLDLLNQGAVDDFEWMMEEERTLYPHEAQVCRFLNNHDNDRTLTALGNNEGRNRLAAVILLTLPGTPMIYYGEEIGMRGDKPPDQNVRKFMEWEKVERQTHDLGSLLSWHRRLVHLRKKFPALSARHDARSITHRRLETDDPDLYAYLRSSPGEIPVLVLGNLSGRFVEGRNLRLDSSSLPSGDHRLREIFPDSWISMKVRVGEDGDFSFTLPRKLGRYGSVVMSMERE